MIVQYGEIYLEVPDGSTDDELNGMVSKLPQETRDLAFPKQVTQPVEEQTSTYPLEDQKQPLSIYRAIQTGKDVNPIVKMEAERRALEQRYGYIADEPFSITQTLKNVPRNIEDIAESVTSLISGSLVFAYRFGADFFKDVNDFAAKGESTDFSNDFARIAKDIKPATDLFKAIYVDWGHMLSGELPAETELDKTAPGQMVNRLIEHFESRGVGGAIKDFVQDRPVDAMLFATSFYRAIASGSRIALETANKAIPAGTKAADALESVLSRTRSPIRYRIGPGVDVPLEKGTIIHQRSLADITEVLAKEPERVGELFRGVAPETAAKTLRQTGAVHVSDIADAEARATAKENLEKAIAELEDTATRAVKFVDFPREYSKDPLSKYIFQKTADYALDKYPELKQALARHKAKGLVQNMRNYFDEANFNERVAFHEDIAKHINDLPKDERDLVIPYLEGRAQLLHEPSQQFKEFESWYRLKAEEIKEDLIEWGKLDKDTAAEMAYQPLAAASGKTVEEVKEELGTFSPVYVHHTFPQRFEKKMGIHFADTTGKRYKPGMLKKRRGAWHYSEKLDEVLPVWGSQYVKLKNTEEFISNLTEKFGVKTNIKDIRQVDGGIELADGRFYPGYKILAPDGYLSFYKQELNAKKLILELTENMTLDEAIAGSISELPDDIVKAFMAVSKNKTVYLVPEEISRELESMAAPIFGSQKAQDVVRLIVDKPSQFWKDSVLLSPRWIKNNMFGDLLFNSVEGVGVLSYTRAFQKVYTDLIPDILVKKSFANLVKYNAKLGKTMETSVGKYVEALYNTKVVQIASKIKDKGYALNTMCEQPFVRAFYIKKARELAVKRLKASGMKVNEQSILDMMATIKRRPELHEPIIKELKETLPVFNLTGSLERKYVRRMVPFVNWYKFMIQWGARLPKKHPFLAVGARGLGALAEDQREKAYVQFFPWMARDIEKNGIPARFKGLWPVSVNENEAVFFNARSLNPITTLEQLVSLDLLPLVSPLFTVPIEQVTGTKVYSGGRFTSPDKGIVETSNGIKYEPFAKVAPPLWDHILRQIPEYQMLKDALVDAKQFDTGTLFNPEPILNDIGQPKYPIDVYEKILNFAGISRKTLDVRQVWDQYIKSEEKDLSAAAKNAMRKGEISEQDMRKALQSVMQDKKLMKQIREEVKAEAEKKMQERQELRRQLSKQPSVKKRGNISSGKAKPSDELISSLKRHEGFRSKPYKDTTGNMTVGYGHKILPGEDFSGGITKAEAEELLKQDIAKINIDIPDGLSSNQRDVLIEMAFNLGNAGVKKFKKMYAALEKGDFKQAAKEMKRSKWARQVGKRADELARRMSA